MFQKVKKAALAAAALSLVGMGLRAESTVSLGYSGYLDANYSFNTNDKLSGFGETFGLDVNAADSSLGVKGTLSLVQQKITDTNYDNLTYPYKNKVNAEGKAIGIDQAFVEKSVLDGLNIRIGRIYTFVGYEVVPVVKNANVSNSLLFNIEPAKHDALEAIYSSGALTLLGMVANNSQDNSLKDYGAQIAYADKGLSLSGSYLRQIVQGTPAYYYGAPFTPPTVSEPQHIFNVVAQKSGEDYNLGAEYFYITQIGQNGYMSINIQPDPFAYYAAKNPKMQGYSLYGQYKVGSISVSPRFTALYMPDGVDLENASSYSYGSPNQGQPDTKFQYTLTTKYKTGAFTGYLEGNWIADCAASKEYGDNNIQGTVLAGASYEF